MEKEAQKKLGAFYTPRHTVGYMISRLKSLDEKSNLLEPSGGDGVFVSEILKRRTLSPSQITVWDINPEVKNSIRKMGIENITIKDSLLETHFNDKSLFKIEEFSHIIGNPPYLNKQSFYIKKNKQRLGKIFEEIGANDTYAMFLYLGCKLLKEKGELCFIVSDTFLTLGIHKKLRRFLLQNFTINEITLCPRRLFRDSGALVNTAITHLTKIKPTDSHDIVFNDCRDNDVGDYSGKVFKTRQKRVLSFPDYVFNFNGGSKLLGLLDSFGKMINHLDGGLGMHTTNNKRFLAVVDYNGKRFASNGVKTVVSHKEIDGKKWKFYHKKGGENKYYLPAEFALRWDSESRRFYNMPKNYDLNQRRRGFVVSGISSSLSARLSTPGALWESNKAMSFFPKNSRQYPVEFFIGVLNSKTYGDIARFLNHTNSVQIRDVKKFPMPEFNGSDIKIISEIAKRIIEKKKRNLNYNFKQDQKRIDEIVSVYFK